MTPSATANVRTNSGVHSESTTFTRPKRTEVERAVRDEARSKGRSCSRTHADWFVAMLIRAASLGRANDYKGAYRLSDWELEQLHPLLSTIMPDDVVIPAPGSAHELLQQYILDGRELALVHTREGANLCVIALRLESV